MFQKNNKLDYMLARFEKHGIVKSYSKSEYIFNESDITDKVYIVKKGKIEIHKLTKGWDERILFILSGCNILNEEVLFSKTSECATCCKAFDDCEVLIVPKDIIIKEMKNDFQLVEYIFSCTTLKLKRSYRQLKNSGTNVTIEKKVASKLWKLAVDYGVETKEGLFIDIALSSTIISKMVGAKRETISRCLNTFKKNKIIKVDGENIIILDVSMLKGLFEVE